MTVGGLGRCLERSGQEESEGEGGKLAEGDCRYTACEKEEEEEIRS